MKITKAYLAGALLAAAAAMAGAVPEARAFPEREIEVIVNYGAGGGTDLSTRVLADAAAKILGQPLRIVNRAGGSGTVGPTFVATAKPDGYTSGGARRTEEHTSERQSLMRISYAAFCMKNKKTK